MSDRKDLLKNKGRIKVLDELAATKAFVEIGVVDNVQISHPANPVEIKTPSGITIYKSVDLDTQLSFDLYHPGDLKVIERLFRGAVTRTEHDGSTAVAGAKQRVIFRNAGDVAALVGFDGDGTAVTVNSIKDVTETTTYTVTTDYTVNYDSESGLTLITHVGAGSLPLDTEVLVNYDYTPAKSQELAPNTDGTLIDRFMVIESYPDCSDTSLYRKFILPRMTVESDLVVQLLEIGEDNTNPNILSVTMSYKKPDVCQNLAEWKWFDSYNHLQ